MKEKKHWYLEMYTGELSLKDTLLGAPLLIGVIILIGFIIEPIKRFFATEIAPDKNLLLVLGVITIFIVVKLITREK